jgi:hypothetical protein
MSTRAQNLLSTLFIENSDDLWAGKPNEWLRKLQRAGAGKVGEQLAQKVIGGKLLPNSKFGYDLEFEDKKIEVKMATLSITNDKKIFAWMAIRPSDPYTHICFIAVYPEDVRLFLVPREKIPIETFPRSNSTSERKVDMFQLFTRKTNTLLPWMTPYEIL